ncbi:OLC1v1021103C1 [Oldenlandia corymbosa var. corymbosa]|nr:OLC1v1021103C1 [Oldenlandia corymbosa var. corymbosa]
MLDLECDDLIEEMFSTFFSVARDDHPESVITSMQTIMSVLIEESEDVPEDLLLNLLSHLGRNKKDVTAAARRLAMKVVEQCAGKLESSIKQFLIASMSGDSRSSKYEIDYYEVIYDIYLCAPQVLSGVVPYLTGELLTDQLDTRLKAVKLVGDLFALEGSSIPEIFQPILLEFLKRLTDRVVEVRMSVLDHIKTCLFSNPSRPEAPQIIAALCDRLLDYDENVRKQVVGVVCDVACRALTSIPVETVKLVSERLRDKSLLVKKFTMERLAEIYKTYCTNCVDGSIGSDVYDWIPGKLLRCFYDKDFRSDVVEPILSLSLFPSEFFVKDKVKNWVRSFAAFDKVEVKALEKILEQKQRLQQEMQRYLSLRQMHQDGDPSEIQKKITFAFRVMSRYFSDPAKAEENFQILDQIKDANVWKILKTLLDPNTNTSQAFNSRDDLLRILGDKHRLFEFLSILSLKCSNLLFGKEHSKEILHEASTQKSAGNAQLIVSCMSILVILARFFPLLLGGIEEDLVHLLEDDNEIIKEGVLHVLARAGAAIREQLGVSSRSLDLILERICIEGSRRQAKYAVHALASITKDDGLMSLSVLYKRLVDMLQEKSHLPAVLQSLGCIAQTAMPVFETRETEIEEFIKKNLLECSCVCPFRTTLVFCNKLFFSFSLSETLFISQASEDGAKDFWDDRSELCSLKIFGLKTLVKSFLPVKDSNLRLGIDDLIGVLKNILCYGEISREIKSSLVDKAHLRLAAAKAILRLSKIWDDKIPVDVFYLTLRVSEESIPEVRRLFLGKCHQYIKDRILDPKYACAFLLDNGSQQHLSEEEKHNLVDIIQMCQQGKARQYAAASDVKAPPNYPEYVVTYLVHALAHDLSFPDPDECTDAKAYELIYRQLYSFLSMLVQVDGDGNSGKSDAVISKDKESISALVSIFESIKRSEDNVDATKSKNLYAVCDLGLLIMKRLAATLDSFPEFSVSVPLPTTLYKSLEAKEGEGNDKQVGESLTWLDDEGALAYFASIKLEANKTVVSEVVDDESMKDSETDGSEMPLGKILQRLRAKGAKARREIKSELAMKSGEKTGDDLDILKMVKEINSNTSGSSPRKFDSSNGHDKKETKIDRKKQSQKRKAGFDESTDVPKRRRSSSGLGHKPSHLKKTSRVESMQVDDGFSSGSEGHVSNEPAEFELEGSLVEKGSSFPSNHKGKRSSRGHDQKKSKRTIEANHALESSNSDSAAAKKKKRQSISGLAKCTAMESETPTTDLIGCRIKVWWPMDKEFYEGVVKSFDTEKKKHVVLYDDGDVEVLRLEKERWELVGEEDQKTRSKPSKSMRSKAMSKSLEKKNKKSIDISEQKKETVGERLLKLMNSSSPSSKTRGKRTPRKNIIKHERKDESKGGGEGVSDGGALSNRKNDSPVSEGRDAGDDAEKTSSDSDKAAQKKSPSYSKGKKSLKNNSQESSGNENGASREEVSSSDDEETETNFTREEESGQEVNDDEMRKKSDSEGDGGEDAHSKGLADMEVSDNELLVFCLFAFVVDIDVLKQMCLCGHSSDMPIFLVQSVWKRRVVKSSEGKKRN